MLATFGGDWIDPEALQQLLQTWGYGVIFVAMLLENAGLPLPGETVTLLGGYAAGSGQLHGLGVMAAAAGGAILGDNIGYWVGRRAGWNLILRVGGLLRQSPEQLDRLREQFLRHSGKSVLLGRFVAVLRVVVREGFSADLARSLWEDLHAVLTHLDAIKPEGHFTQEHFAH